MKTKGLTLIEVLTAVAILAVVTAAVSSGIVSSLASSADSRRTAIANQVAQGILERYRNHWSTLERYRLDPSPSTRPAWLDLTQAPDGSWAMDASWAINIDDTGKLDANGNPIATFDPNAGPAVRVVVVTISYKGRQKVRLETRIARPAN
jgi:prepilin-type N-terminal cleavage/methylation domain-containing protein